MAEKVPSGVDEFAYGARGNAALRHFDGCFDHRQSEALDPEAIGLEVPPLGFEQSMRQVVRLGIFREQGGKAFFRQPVELLVLP